MISETDVRMAYRLFLGREPENSQVVAEQVRELPSLTNLRKKFMRSSEFATALASVDQTIVVRPSQLPYTRIETDVPAETHRKLIRHIEASWTQLGQSEPHWSVLTRQEFRKGAIAANETAFYESGAEVAGMLRQAAERCAVDVAAFAGQSGLELGCGVGRITMHLSKMFARVVAADISPAHLTVARDALGRAGRRNVDCVHISEIGAIAKLPMVDAFLSIIVLQHNPPPLMKTLLAECLGRLNPNGIGYFQLPFYGTGYRFAADDYIARVEAPGYVGGMEMHALPQPVIFEVVEQAGCRVLEILEDGWAGEQFRSCSLLVRKC